MTMARGQSLAKVTITTPKRLIDVALPEDVAAAELLPHILRHAGEDAADAGERHAGWLLRRPTGEYLEPDKTLGAQQVLDGELLHLVPGQQEWPELEYEDLVETIASGARRHGRSWGKAATRRCGLALCGAALLAGTLLTLRFEPPWLVPGITLLVAAVVLMAAGVVVARAVPDAHAAVVLAGCGLPYAFLGGLVVTAPDHAGLADVGAAQLRLALIALLVFGVAGYVGVTALPRVFAAAIMTGVLGALGATLAGGLGTDAAAAVVLAAGIGLLPGYPMLAIRLGRLPFPALPQRPADLLADEPPPPKAGVYEAAARTDEILSGLLAGLAVVGVACSIVLVADGRQARVLLVTLAAVALLLRARLFPIPRQRLPLLLSGSLLIVMLAGSLAVGATDRGDVILMLLAVFGLAFLLAAAGVVYSRKNPSPYLGRIGDICDVLAILALIPFAAYIAGFFTYVQGLMAGIG